MMWGHQLNITKGRYQLFLYPPLPDQRIQNVNKISINTHAESKNGDGDSRQVDRGKEGRWAKACKYNKNSDMYVANNAIKWTYEFFQRPEGVSNAFRHASNIPTLFLAEGGLRWRLDACEISTKEPQSSCGVNTASPRNNNDAPAVGGTVKNPGGLITRACGCQWIGEKY